MAMRRVMRRLAAAGLYASGAAALALGGWLAWPLPASLMARDGANGVAVEARDGAVLRATRAADGSRAAWVPYEQTDPDLIAAFVAVEDRRFWEHPGVDVRGVARAARDNLRARRVVSGASTMTMSLVRLLRPKERSWGGKGGRRSGRSGSSCTRASSGSSRST